MATNYPNGLGATSGSVIATDAPLYTTGSAWYVHYGTGTDAVSPRGKDDKKPLKTLAQAGVKSVKIAPIVQSNSGEVNYQYHRPLVKTVRRQGQLHGHRAVGF